MIIAKHVIRRPLTVCALTACLIAFTASRAMAEQATHVFNASLSLTGDCSTSSLDPTPDPGCPGGVHPPNGPFGGNPDIATDRFGDIYVSSPAGSEGRIDIFNPQGEFLAEIATPRSGPLAIDSEGNLYASTPNIVRYTPTVYNPQAGEIAYSSPTVVKGQPYGDQGVAVDPATGHLFVTFDAESGYVEEYSSAAEGNKLVGNIGEGQLYNPDKLAIDAARKRIYVTTYAIQPFLSKGEVFAIIRVFNLEAPHELVATIDGSTSPKGTFLSTSRPLGIAIDEETGHIFVGDLEGTPEVYEFAADGSYVSTFATKGMQSARDNVEMSVVNGAGDPTRGYLFVPSGITKGHALAFEPKPQQPPAIKSLLAGSIAETEAVLSAEVNPGSLPTGYRFEYVTQQGYEEGGNSFAGAAIAAEGSLTAGAKAVAVSAGISGLRPGTAYVLRLVAENEEGAAEAQAAFATYGTPDRSSDCANEGLRTGFSAALPDCRAYELVTPPNTNGHAPGANLLGTRFASPSVSADGEALSFEIQGGALTGFDAPGSYAGDPYVARHTPGGWDTAYEGPTGAETLNLIPGSASPDQGYSFWSTGGGGGSAELGTPTSYLRYPDGHSALIGRGSLGSDPRATGELIAEGGRNMIFESAVKLEEQAPPSGNFAVYDRLIDPATGEEKTQVVSLLPGDVTPTQPAQYDGSSRDGRGIAFSVGNRLYLRYLGEKTYEIGEGVIFEGVSEGGGRIFYLQGGALYAFDAKTEARIAFSSAGNVVPVNVAADGTAAYFVSQDELTSQANPNGATAQPGEENLYFSREGQISFVGTVSERDVKGILNVGVWSTDGLGLWSDAVGQERFGVDPSRATPDGSLLVFESEARLTSYDTEGHREVYRYDSTAGSLTCLSCNPTTAPPSGGASLQPVKPEEDTIEPSSPYALLENVRADGGRVFFQSSEALVAADIDGVQDVYEWEQNGTGSCRTQGGCTYLVSSGLSAHPNYLYALSASGDDVFIETPDLLLPAQDPDETPSIYDARVNGGFPPAPVAAGECLGEACQPAAVAPLDATPVSVTFAGHGNMPAATVKPRCAKGRRLVKRNGKPACATRHAKPGRRRGRHTNRKGRAKRRAHR